MPGKINFTRVLYLLAWPLLWCFGFVFALCTRGVEAKWKPPKQKRRADWRQGLQAGGKLSGNPEA